MDNKRLDEAVEVALRAYYEDGAIVCKNPALKKDMRAAILASLPVLLGEPVAEVIDAGVKKLRVYPDAGLPALLDFPVGTKFYAPSLGEGHE